MLEGKQLPSFLYKPDKVVHEDGDRESEFNQKRIRILKGTSSNFTFQSQYIIEEKQIQDYT